MDKIKTNNNVYIFMFLFINNFVYIAKAEILFKLYILWFQPNKPVLLFLNDATLNHFVFLI